MRERAGLLGTVVLWVLGVVACSHVGSDPTGAPTITSQPSNQTVAAGATATFTVMAAGAAPLSYQWLRNGAAISGANGPSYSLATSSSDNGASFAVTVSNASGSVQSTAATLTVNPGGPSITAQPQDQTVVVGTAATFNVTASGVGTLTYQWARNGTAIAGATGSSYSTAATTNADNGALYSVVVSNSIGSATSRSAVLTVTGASAGTDIVTYKYDVARTGANTNESLLTPVNVTAATFGKLRFLTTDGKVDAQPLYLSGFSVGGAVRNVVYVATENDSVYAFDADSGAQLWHVSLVPSGETVVDLSASCDETVPVIGITATPVIDRAAGALYVVAMTKSGGSSTWHQRLHALSLTSGADLRPATDISASYPSAGGSITFDPMQYEERAGLLLLNHTIYTAWTSHCDNKFYTGWIMGFSAADLGQTAVVNIAPNSGGAGPSIWMSGGGLAADSSGSIYLLSANGVFDTTLDANGFPNMGDYANAFVRLDTSSGLRVADYFALYNTVVLSNNDVDLGSGGVMLLPDLTDANGTVRQLAVGAGKDGNIYVVERGNMGKFDPNGNNIWQEVGGQLGNVVSGGVWGTPAYFNGHVYYCGAGLELASFSVSNARLSSTPTTVSAADFPYPGSAPSVSANGTSNGIVWAHMNTNPAALYAFDANDMTKVLYHSDDPNLNGRDNFGPGNKFITPVVADGKVFVGTTTGVAVFGLF
ncbi:MAG: pyrrolo-quinoline quinone [Gammaproteobacteria bacterium]|nr:pyrrolo-quinoline quinone [Gammaproteobacteria bacterium]